MSQLDADLQTTANNLESVVLKSVAHVGQKSIVEALGRDKGAVSNFFSNQKGITLTLREMCVLIAALELKTVEKSQQTFDAKEFHSYKFLATK